MKGISLVLLLPGLLLSQTLIYRSVQQSNTTAIADLSANAITISGSTLTATNALPDTVGVGDAVQYDSSNAGTVNAICFIHGRTSSTVFTVKRFNGGTPASCTGDTDGDIFRAHTAITSWESRTENTGIAAGVRDFDGGASWNLVTANQQWHVAIYGQNQGGGITIDNWTTGSGSSENYIRIYVPKLTSEVGTSQRHSGSYNTTKVKIGWNATFWGCRNLSPCDKIIFEGIQWDAAGATADTGIRFQSDSETAHQEVFDCIFKGFGSGSSASGIYVEPFANGTPAGTLYIYNNIVYDWTAASSAAIDLDNPRAQDMTAYVYNNTIIDCVTGINCEGGTGATVVKNNLCYSNSTADFQAGAAWTNAENNASSDATAPGTNSRTNQTFTFVDEAGNNFLLGAADAGARNFGKDLSEDANLAITTDIVGTLRTSYLPYDMGAHEVQAVLGSLRRIIIVK